MPGWPAKGDSAAKSRHYVRRLALVLRYFRYERLPVLPPASDPNNLSDAAFRPVDFSRTRRPPERITLSDQTNITQATG
jgi:hypothetical protein